MSTFALARPRHVALSTLTSIVGRS
jgi:hypothetical protein